MNAPKQVKNWSIRCGFGSHELSNDSLKLNPLAEPLLIPPSRIWIRGEGMRLRTAEGILVLRPSRSSQGAER